MKKMLLGLLLLTSPAYAACDAQTVTVLHLNTDTSDSSTAAHTWTLQSGASIDGTAPKFGAGSLLLNGSSDYIDSADSADWDFDAGDFTVECWVKFASTGGDQCVFSRNSNQFFLAFTSDAIWASINGATTTPIAVSTDTTTWHALAWDRSGTTNRIYYDGAVIDTFTDGGSIDETATMNVGRRSNSTWFFNGRIDEVRISKGVARYAGAYTPATSEFCSSASNTSNMFACL